MATGKSSNLGASSSTKTAKEEEKRKQSATRAEKAKKPRPFQLINFTAQPRGSGRGTAVPGVVPLHRGASNMAAAAFPFPMAGVNGAAPLWSTAASLGAASRAAALTLSSLPATASANGPVVIAPAPSQQPPAGAAASNAATAAAAALALPAPSSGATSVRPPLVLAQAGAGGQLVPLPLHFVGYHPTCRASALLPAPAVGIPLAAALDKIENGALGRMLSALMRSCYPPLRQHQSKTGPPPPWWPTGSEDWWATELLAHLDDSVAAPMRAPAPVPFASSYSLKKAQKVAVLVAIVKHLAPDFARIAAAVRHSGKLSASETGLWHSALNNERAKYTRPVFILLPQPQPQQQGGGGGDGSAGTDPSAAGSVVVVQVANLSAPAGAPVSASADGSRGEVIAAAKLVVEKEQRSDSVGVGVVVSATDDAPAGDDGRDQPVNYFPAGGELLQVANLPASASVSAPAEGSRGEVIAAAELVVEKEQRRDSDGVGVGVSVVVSATDDAPAGDDGRDQPVNSIPAGGNGSPQSPHKQGDAVVAAAPTTGHVSQVAGGGPPEMTTMQQPEQADGGVPGDDVAAAAAAEDEQVHQVVVAPGPNADAVAPAIEDEAPEDGHWWCNSDELNRMFAEFESFGDDVWY